MNTVTALHSALGSSEALWLAVTSLGRDEVYIVVLALYSWLVNPAGMRQLGLAFSLSYLTNTALKYGFNLPRPFVSDPDLASAAARATATGPGLPSGHAQMTATLWLGMAWQLQGARVERTFTTVRRDQRPSPERQAAHERQQQSSRQLAQSWGSADAGELVDAWARANSSPPARWRIPGQPEQDEHQPPTHVVYRKKVRSDRSLRLVWFLAFVVVLLVSLSRLVLGVHFPSDILVGLILGILFATLSSDTLLGLIAIPAYFFLLSFSMVFPPDKYEYPKYSLSGKFFISLAVYIISFYMINFVFKLLNLKSGRSKYWIKNLLIIVAALLVANLIPNTIPRELAAGLGLLTGFALLGYKFSAPTSWAARIGVAVIGLALVFAVYAGLSALLPLGLRESSVGRMIRYALLVLMAGEGVPRLLRMWLPERPGVPESALLNPT